MSRICFVKTHVSFNVSGTCCGQKQLFCMSRMDIVIDQKRIFLFRPKTNICLENAAEYSADNEYSAKEENVAQIEKK
jgi:hypothetical protein